MKNTKQTVKEFEIVAVGDEALEEEVKEAERERDLNAMLQMNVRHSQNLHRSEQSKTAQELINEVGLLSPTSPSFAKITKPMDESVYFRTKHETILVRGRR